MIIKIKNNNIPPEGNNSNLFERLSTYISKVDKDWVNKIKSAKKESIDLLKKLSQIEKVTSDFPEVYKIFLEHMGENDEELMRAQYPGPSSIKELLWLYEWINKYAQERLNPYYLHFCRTDLVCGELSFDLGSDINNPRIIETDEGKYVGFFAENFEKLLFQNAFLKYEKLYHNKYIRFAGSKNMLDKALESYEVTDIFEIVKEFSIDNNCEKAWFSDQRHFICANNELSFFVLKQDQSVAGFIAGDDNEYISDLAKTITYKIGTKIKIH